ncbi:MAG: FHA domain-containing protein, partial [Anaerolineales bacterium]
MELVIEHGANQGERFSISQPRFTIGRGRQCDVTLPDARVSQCHAEIRWQDGAWIVYDRHSANGTWVNRRRLNGPYQLRPGDQLGVGRTIISFSRMESAGAMDAPVAMPGASAPAGFAGVADAPLSFVLDGLTALGALMLIVGPLLNWFSYVILFFEEYIGGTDILIGRIALIGGIIALLLAVIALLLRLVLRSGERSVQNLAPYLRWIPWLHVTIAGAMIALSAAQMIRYNQEAQTEVFFGITIEDIVALAALSPEPGIFITGAGLSLLLVGAVGQIAATKLSARG